MRKFSPYAEGVSSKWRNNTGELKLHVKTNVLNSPVHPVGHALHDAIGSSQCGRIGNP
ncbi:hypothetical protein Pla52n_63610 [Stieleria varia]|uniref:Uncharacterized protein n=1 Tax=Stieleria varia TaxID=2528005 RepID=A0A5C5ZWS8_9BACT|nr:hypothetical protein Pla52n_63610 [Stieleria varia]